MNKLKVLEFIKENSDISRVELAKKLGYSPAGVGKIVDFLLEKKLILEMGEKKSTGGRRATTLVINKSNFGKILGVYFAPKFAVLSIGNIDGEIINNSRVEYKEEFWNFFEKVEQEIKEILEKIEGIEIISVVINGLVDSKNGVVKFSPHYNIKNIDLKKEWNKKYKKNIFVENDVRAMAMTEKIFGSCKKNKNYVVLNFDEGVGGSLFLEDKIYQGNGYTSGEVGHIVVKRNSLERCSCGKRGCLETEVSNRAILKKIKSQILFGNTYSSLKKIYEKKSYLTIEDICKEAEKKDMVAINILKETIGYIGYGIDIIISVINPEKIILYGDIFSSKYVLNNLLQEVKKVVLEEQNCEIEISNYCDKIYFLSPFSVVNFKYKEILEKFFKQ